MWRDADPLQDKAAEVFAEQLPFIRTIRPNFTSASHVRSVCGTALPQRQGSQVKDPAA